MSHNSEDKQSVSNITSHDSEDKQSVSNSTSHKLMSWVLNDILTHAEEYQIDFISNLASTFLRVSRQKTDSWTDRQTYRRINKQTAGQTDRQKYRQTNIHTDRQTYRQTNRKIDS